MPSGNGRKYQINEIVTDKFREQNTGFIVIVWN